jgi:hypothetical protein
MKIQPPDDLTKRHKHFFMDHGVPRPLYSRDTLQCK